MTQSQAAKRKERRRNKAERDHERELAFLEIMKADPEIKWIMLLGGGMAIDGLADAIQATTETPEQRAATVERSQYETYGTAIGALYGGVGGAVMGRWVGRVVGEETARRTYDNPWQLAAGAMEGVGEGLQGLAITMLTLHAIFGTGGGDDGGLFGKLAGML